jgi:ribonuclease BN (tRNA processing enzyme)
MRRSTVAALFAALTAALVTALPLGAQSRCSQQGVSVQVLGSGGPRAGTERASSSYLVWIDGESRVMVDVGGGAFARFGESGASLATLDLLAISHFHPDHASDLPALLWLSDQARPEPLPTVGPSGNDAFPSLDELLHQLFDPRAGAFRILSGPVGGPGAGVLLEPTTVDVTRHEPVTVLETPEVTVRALPVPHTNAPALAYRVETRGVSIVFSSDQTGADPRFVDFARGADLLVMHMAIPVGSQGAVLEIHATPERVGQVARDAGVSHLVLSHLVRTQVQLEGAVGVVRDIYQGTMDAARDLDCFRVG